MTVVPPSGGVLLAIDTCGPVCAARLEAADGSLLAERAEPMERGHAERLIPLVHELLAGVGMRPSALGVVACTTGPGSLTGIRVGVAAARALALALGIPSIGVGTLATLFPPADGSPAIRIAALDGPRGAVFAEAVGGQGEPVLAPQMIEAERLAAVFAPLGRPLRLGGVGARRLTRHLDADTAEIVHERAAADLAHLSALVRAGAGVSPPRPLYLRAPDATPARPAPVLA